MINKDCKNNRTGRKNSNPIIVEDANELSFLTYDDKFVDNAYRSNYIAINKTESNINQHNAFKNADLLEIIELLLEKRNKINKTYKKQYMIMIKRHKYKELIKELKEL